MQRIAGATLKTCSSRGVKTNMLELKPLGSPCRSDEGLTSLLEGYEKLQCGDRAAWLASKLQLQGRTDSNR